MRLISEFNPRAQASGRCVPPEGGKILSVELPAGWRATVERERNSSYTFTIYNSHGADVVKENTGANLICAALAGGVGLTVFSYSGGNVRLGQIAASLTFAGCNSIMEDSWEDGDEQGLPEC